MNLRKYLRRILILSSICLFAREANAADITTFSDVNVLADRVTENADAGVSVGVTVEAVGVAGAGMTYTMDDDASGRFTVNPTTGIVTTTG